MALTKVTFAMIDGAFANVLDYGAVGDGVTDDTAAIQSAVASNTTLFFPAGTYKISTKISFTNLSNFSVCGDKNAIVELSTGSSSVLYFDTCDSFSVSGLTLIGTKTYSDPTAGCVSLINSTNFEITGNTCKTSCRCGIVTQGSSKGIISNNICSDSYQDGILVRNQTDAQITVVGNVCYGNGTNPLIGEGIHIYEASNVTITGNVCESNLDNGIALEGGNECVVSDNIVKSNLGRGISIAKGGASTTGWDNVVSNNIVTDSLYDGIIVENVSHIVISGNKISSNTRAGIYMSTDAVNPVQYCTVENNIIHSNITYGMLIDWACSYCNIIGNIVKGSSSYGILVNRATCISNLLSLNKVSGYSVKQIQDNGTTTRIYNNDVGNKVNGTATLSSGTYAVTFAVKEPSSAYQVLLTGNQNETFRVTSVSDTGFTITSSNGSSTANVNWYMVG